MVKVSDQGGQSASRQACGAGNAGAADRARGLGGLRTQLATLAPLTLCALGLAPRAHAQGYPTGPYPMGLVLEAAGELGGQGLVSVRYRNGATQTIRAGDGVTLAAGVHFEPIALPIDFAATVGYKFAGTADARSDLGIDRVVVKATGTVLLPLHWWVDAGPVWHTDTRIRGGGYFQDVHFDDAVGGTVGVGWRWVGVSYTYIQYSNPEVSDVNGSSGGITFTWKF